ncbi:hypothetical protein CMO89_01670 [Candidatus Woesearchaeota archaeon]|nr:hypothetical protein [Candidatus Woesearchaeota archaeon]|tara:strand:- start:5992 stop:6396 length:405 start_codon:yes stop_codon:yes gene_type:complete
MSDYNGFGKPFPIEELLERVEQNKPVSVYLGESHDPEKNPVIIRNQKSVFYFYLPDTESPYVLFYDGKGELRITKNLAVLIAETDSNLANVEQAVKAGEVIDMKVKVPMLPLPEGISELREVSLGKVESLEYVD